MRAAVNSTISTASPSPSGRAASPGCASASRRHAAPHVASRADHVIIAAIDARNEQVYFQVFAPNGTTIVTPRLDRVRAAVRAVPVGAAVVTGSAAELVAAHWPSGSPAPLVETHAAPDIGWVARLGAAAREEGAAPKPLYLRRPDAHPQEG